MARSVEAKSVNKDRRMMLIVIGLVLVLIVVISILAPARQGLDPRPTTTNADPGGAKAAFLLLSALGYKTSRWTKPFDEIDSIDASHTTLVLADPVYQPQDKQRFSAAIQRFLENGGHVLSTGWQGGEVLPKQQVVFASENPPNGPCHTTPDGPGPLAQAGEVELPAYARWKDDDPSVRVEQRCGSDAVVVRYPVGKGEAIWWASAVPLTNAGLKKDASLRLLLASVGNGRDVVFDESLHIGLAGLWGKAKGLPLNWIKAQAVLIALLLLLSFSRRRGPVRPVVSLPRTSPVEFAASMGALYGKAGATGAATEAANRRLLRMLELEAGLSQATLDLGPQSIVDALAHRFDGDWSSLALHLEAAQTATRNELTPRSALTLVKALREDEERIRTKLRPSFRTNTGAEKIAVETP